MKSTTSLFGLVLLLSVASVPAIQASEFGEIGGEGIFHTRYEDWRESTDAGYANLHLKLHYATPEYSGFSAFAQIRTGLEVWEYEDDDADGSDGFVLSELFLQYKNDTVLFRVGRQELGVEWINEYHEAVLFEISPYDFLKFETGYTLSRADVDYDSIQEDFEDLGDDGLFFLSSLIGKEEGEWRLYPYLYYGSDLFTAYGIIGSAYLFDLLDFRLHFAGVDPDDGTENGYIGQAEIGASVKTIYFYGGLIATDEDGDIGPILVLGDNVSPFEEGNLVYEPDTLTWYAGAEYEAELFNIGVLLGGSDSVETDELEVDFFFQYDLGRFLDNLSVALTFAVIDSDEDEADYSVGWFTLNYAFGTTND